jgi:UDP-N-acetylmuramate dehydrogenase
VTAPEGQGVRQAVRDSLREGSTLLEDAPLAPLTTLRIGGPADLLVDLESEGDLVRLAEAIKQHDIPYWVLGKGSNVLVPDAGLRALVIRLGKAFRQFRVEPEGGLAWGGAALANATFVEQARGAGLGGMEFLVTVPGSLGGAIAMNAGAFGGETAGFLKSVRLLDLHLARDSVPPMLSTESAQAFSFSYRHSPLRGQAGRIVLAGAFRLVPSTDAEIQARKDSHMAYRRNTQPREFPNCGSVFKNPPGHHAARLIEEAGLKGHRLGGAQISEKHANFIVNRGNASCADVLALIDLAQRTVYHRTQVRLEPEVQVVETVPHPSAHS